MTSQTIRDYIKIVEDATAAPVSSESKPKAVRQDMQSPLPQPAPKGKTKTDGQVSPLGHRTVGRSKHRQINRS